MRDHSWAKLDTMLVRLYWACSCIAASFMVILMVLVCYSVLARYLGLYAGLVSDVAGYMVAAMSFLALPYTLIKGGHIRVRLLLSALPLDIAIQIFRFSLVMMLIASSFLAFSMSKLAYLSWAYNQLSEGVDAWPLWIPQLPVALGAVILFVSVAHICALEMTDRNQDYIKPR